MGEQSYLVEDPWSQDYLRQTPSPAPPPSPVLTAAPQASGDSGGGFWGGLLGILKNVPITIGDTRKGHIQNLGSYNQLMAGRDLAKWGRDQGLEMQGLGDFPNPDVARFAVQQGLERREKAPIGMETINRLFPVQPGEDPSMAQSRAMLAQVPQHQWGPLMGHLVTQYGLPGFGGESVLDPYAAVRYLPTDDQPPSTALPQPQASPSAGTAPSTAPLATQAPAAPVTTPPPMPSTAPLVAPPGSTGAPGLPQAPAAPSGRVTQQQVLQHPTVTAAQAAYAASRTMQEKRQNALALRNALAQAPAKIQQEQHQRYGEQSQEYRNQLAAQSAQLAAQKAYQEAARAPYGYGQDWDAQIRMDFNLQPGQMPTPEMAQASYPRMTERLTAAKAQETEATKTAQMTTEERIRDQQPLAVALGPDKAGMYRDPQTGHPLVQTKPNVSFGEARQTAPVVTGEQGQRLDDLLDAMPIVQRLNYFIQKIYGPGGIYEGMSGDERRSLTQGLGRAVENVQSRYPILQEAQAFIEANAEKLARAIGGIRGAGTEGDVRRSKALFPELSSAIGLRWEGWKPNLTWDMPDTRGLALRKINDFNVTVDRIAGRILNNPQFQHPGLLPRLPEEPVRTTPGSMNVAPVRSPEEQLQRPDMVRPSVRSRVTGQTFGEAPAPQPPAQKAQPNDQRAVQAAYQQLGITAPPNAVQNPQAFEQFLTAVRTHLGRMRPGTPPQQLDMAVGNLGRALAQQQGTTWPPPR